MFAASSFLVSIREGGTSLHESDASSHGPPAYLTGGSCFVAEVLSLELAHLTLLSLAGALFQPFHNVFA